jgi:hypothetical protein
VVAKDGIQISNILSATSDTSDTNNTSNSDNTSNISNNTKSQSLSSYHSNGFITDYCYFLHLLPAVFL